jgi:hypothetical protein
VQSEENELVEVDVLPLAAAVAIHKGLQGLSFSFIPLSVAQLTAVVDAAVQRLITYVRFYRCSLGSEHLSQLSRLLALPCLQTLFIYGNAQPLIVGDDVPAFCAALRASNLQKLTLLAVRLFHSLSDGLAVLDTLTRHRSIRELILVGNSAQLPEPQLAVGEALGTRRRRRGAALRCPLSEHDDSYA